MARFFRYFFAGIGFWAVSCAVAANPIVNGDFASDLSGWTAIASNGTVQWAGGQAVLSTGPGTDPFSANLVQGDDGTFLFADPVVLTTNHRFFEFDAVFTVLGADSTETPAGGFTDQLSVWIYDALNSTLDQILVQIMSGDGPGFSLDISSFAGRTVAFSFELSDEADGRDSKVAIDNVRVSAVPLPAAIWLFGCGIAILFGFRHPLRNGNA